MQGVASDIVLPSLSDLPEFGEGALKNALPYDQVPKAKYAKWPETPEVFLEELKRRSSARVQASPEFHYVMEDMERLRQRLDDNRISLNEDVRRSEMNEDKLRKEARAKDRIARVADDTKIYRLTLDTVDKPNLQLIMFPGKTAAANKSTVAPEAAGNADSEVLGGDGTKEPMLDPVRDEALNVLGDWVDLSRGPKTASAATP